MKIRSRALNWLVARQCRRHLPDDISDIANSVPHQCAEYESVFQRRVGRIHLLRLARRHCVPYVRGTSRANCGVGQSELRRHPHRFGAENAGHPTGARLQQPGRRQSDSRTARLPANTHFVITPDGPRGPRREVKAGLVFLAAHSGRRIVPTAFSAARSWKIRGSWTDLSIPKPFTRVYALSGVPIYVKPNATPHELAETLAHLQTEMRRLGDQADQLAGVKPQEIDYGTESTQAKAA